MEENVGPLDQTIRIFVGIMAGWEFFLLPGSHWWLIPFALFFILSGSVGLCPIYSFLSASTKKVKAPSV
jgi:hypothetical protein